DVEERVRAAVAGVSRVLVGGAKTVLEVVLALGHLGGAPRPAGDVTSVFRVISERVLRERVRAVVGRVRGELEGPGAGGVGEKRVRDTVAVDLVPVVRGGGATC